jgi:hypothetical protein
MIRRLTAFVVVVCVGVAALALLPTCGKQYALLLTIRAQPSGSPPSVFDLRVKNIATGEVVLERVGEKVDPDDPNRDISQEGQELRVAIEFASEGNYLVYIWARSGGGTEGSQFFLRDFAVDDIIERDITLTPLVEDNDGDGFPACGSAAVTCGPTNCSYLDCDDNDPNINPFAPEVCENGKDDDCSAGCGVDPRQGDAKCTDNDGDGKPAGPDDCDDNDPCRSTGIKEAKNLCGTVPADWDSPLTKACKDKLAKEGKPFTPPFCGDGVDQDCDGTDVECFVDEDCDGFSPPKDCDDQDPKINPQAPEVCDGKDNNCNNATDEGCLPCDVDGDQHAAVGHTGPDCNYPKDDSDDFDAGIHPKTTADDNGKEGGTVLGALRGYCSDALEKNGKEKHRDKDHDGDKLPASSDGCPPENCDEDGDGFQGAQCSPPKSEEDCNDKDPKVFPGAPDLCGNSIAEDCSQDHDCSQDGDKDGYWGSGDCDDKNKNVHPWATEICDRIDNDCDRLIDEGNPDKQGKPIPVDVMLCNDDNDGKCGQPQKNGICACSPVDTRKISTLDPADNRLMCVGESFGDAASPRCFKAIQPQLEECDTEDWNCDGLQFKPGENFGDKGKVCGTDSGECKAGTVTDCNLSQTQSSQVKSVFKSLGLTYNEHWVCSSDTIYPKKEDCNGKNDDCDKFRFIQEVTGADPGWQELDEMDVDKDGYLKCGPCNTSDLAAGITGCNDCKDTAPSIYPTAQEKCDNIDNNCKPGDDGVDECTGGTTCCSSQKACRNLSNDMQNCGQCGKVCPSNVTNQCVGGSCVCGSSPPCTGDRNCVSGSCQCIQGGLCGGCCQNNNCLAGNTTSACGSGGESCDTCTTSDPCKNPVCNSSRDCATTNKSNTTPCPGGRCFGGSCCTNCWDGNSCEPGNTLADCGSGGAYCSSCGTTNPCRTASCATSACVISNLSNGDPCSGGLCYGGNCCTNCWDGDSCEPGNTLAKCGDNGASCQPCGTTDPCKVASCATQSCVISNRSDGDTCSGGECYNGSCCTVCWLGGTCQTSSNESHCGTGGGACDVCGSGQDCQGGSCDCVTGGNCSGCCDGSTCRTSDESHCGVNGASCTACSSGQDCVGGSCDCVAGGNCAGCCDGSTCRPGNTLAQCGSNGASCAPCTAGECETADCGTRTCNTSQASPGTVCSGGLCDNTGSCCINNKCLDASNNCVTNCPSPQTCNTSTHLCEDP